MHLGSWASLLALLTLLRLIPPADSYGYMSTLSTPWRLLNSNDEFTVCGIQPLTGAPFCLGTPSPTNVSLWALSGSPSFSCGLTRSSYTPICWGQTPASQVPSEFRNTSYSTISCGGRHACAIRSKIDPGRVDCWGDNTQGQASPPVNIPFKSLAAGELFTCGLSNFTERVICWGELPANDDPSLRTNQLRRFQSLSAGNSHICGITTGSKVALCWGSNDQGQASPPADVTFSTLAAGTNGTCGLRLSDHSVVCWGKAAGNRGAFSVIAGDMYTCGVRMDSNEVECWSGHRQLSVPLGFNSRRGLCSSEMECGNEEFEMVETRDCSVCSSCSSCGNGMVELQTCKGESDTVCAKVPGDDAPVTPPGKSPGVVPEKSGSVAKIPPVLLTVAGMILSC